MKKITTQLLTAEETARFFRVHVNTVYRTPLAFGLKKLKGVGFRASWMTVQAIAGIPKSERTDFPQGLTESESELEN